MPNWEYFCDKMSLIHEYGERKERRGVAKGMRKGMINVRKQGRREAIEIVVRNLLNSCMSCQEISQRINIPLDKILEIQKGMYCFAGLEYLKQLCRLI